MKCVNSVEVSPIQDQKHETCEGEKLLDAVWSVPLVAPTRPAKIAERINRHYQSARRYQAKYVDEILVPQAKRQMSFYKRFEFPYLPHSMESSYTVTLQSDSVLSLYTDRVEYAGGTSSFITRTGDTWDLQSGFPLHLNLKKAKRKLLRLVEAQAKQMMDAGAGFYMPLRVNLRRYWEPEQWYLTPGGLALYYAQITIAPYEAGIPVFVLPYHQLKGIKPFRELCRLLILD